MRATARCVLTRAPARARARRCASSRGATRAHAGGARLTVAPGGCVPQVVARYSKLFPVLGPPDYPSDTAGGGEEQVYPSEFGARPLPPPPRIVMVCAPGAAHHPPHSTMRRVPLAGVVAVDLDFGRISLAICFDINFGEVPRTPLSCPTRGRRLGLGGCAAPGREHRACSRARVLGCPAFATLTQPSGPKPRYYAHTGVPAGGQLWAGHHGVALRHARAWAHASWGEKSEHGGTLRAPQTPSGVGKL